MDHMRISGTEPSSVILSQKSIFKSWKEMTQTCQKAEAKRSVGITHNMKISNNFNTENLMLSNATNQPKSIVELGYMCPRGLTGPSALTLTKYLKYKETSTKMYTPF